MSLFAGLDVSQRTTRLCIVDDDGNVVEESEGLTEGAALAARLIRHAARLKLVGVEAGSLSLHLYSTLAESGLPVVCVETRHMSRVLKVQARNKTDRNDARGIAQMMRTGLFKPVHVKTERSQRLNVLLKARKILKSKLLDIEADLRMVLRNFGIKVGKVSPKGFDQRVRELLAPDPHMLSVIGPMLDARHAMRQQYENLHRLLRLTVDADPICRRLMTMPGVGPVTALSFRAAVDVPSRFAKSRTVGAHFGLTPRQYQSGLTSRSGRISRSGDGAMRASLYEAAQVLLSRVSTKSALRSWGQGVAQRGGRKKAIVALARKMSIVLHRMWVDETDFRPDIRPYGGSVDS